ncbi:hypothetical protein [Calidifontibacillus oryziterrae]|uniref:hypothetical protein n=1 Tax=Calidifontibacillus oryziterrae TaxID=1191699 RepID=UPI000475B02F|nr:hypothetical protein [Calidifontibacillus oryziterrae]
MASNLLSLPVVAVLIAVFQCSWRFILVFTGMFVGIEWLFLELDLYRHNWWRISYTAIGLPLYFSLAKLWFPKLMLPLRGFLHFITLYLITAALIGNVQITIPMIFLSTRIYEIGWFHDPYHDSSAFAVVYWMIYTFLFTLTLKIRWKRKWLKYPIIVTLTYFLIMILQKYGIHHSLVWWDKWYGVSTSFILLFVSEAINKRIWKGPINIQ